MDVDDDDDLDIVTSGNLALLVFRLGLPGALGVAVAVRLCMALWVVATIHGGSPLTRRFDRLEILQEPEFVPNLVFRGVAGMQVRFHPRSD